MKMHGERLDPRDSRRELESFRFRGLDDDRRCIVQEHLVGIRDPVGRGDDDLVSGIEDRDSGDVDT